MSNWLLTGDWQTDYKNLDVCMQAHGQELYLAKKHNAQGIIDVGDLKDSYNPIEARVLEFVVDRLGRIRDNGFDELILMGNHDRIGQYDDSRNWFGVFKAMNLAAVSKPKLVVYEKVVFGCLPYMHNKHAYKKAAKTLWEKASKYRGYRRVLLFHADVQGADYGLGERSTSDITTADLLCSKWHFCFGGHIHKRQYIAKNAMYVGNPFCFDWGERNQEKGFVLYNDETNTVEILKSNIPNWYSYAYLVENGYRKVATGTRIQVPVKCKISDDYYVAVTKKQEEVLKRFPNAKVYTKTEFIYNDKATAPLIEASATDLDKIKSYVAAKAPDSLEQKRAVKYLESVLSKVSGSIRSQEGLRIKSIKARNVLSFNKLDFSFENRGIVLIVGNNKDWPKHSNGAGKTNFLSMLPIAWCGETLKKQKHDDWLNEHTKENSKGYLDLKIEDIHQNAFKIHRSRNPDELQFFCNKRDESEDKQAKTQKAINDVLGFTLETLKSSVYIDASLPKAFIEGTQTERTGLISKFQNLERFKLAREAVGKDVRRSEREIDSLQEREQDTKDLVASARQEIKTAKKDLQASVKDLKRSVTKAKKRLKKLLTRETTYQEQSEPKYANYLGKFNNLDSKEKETAREIYVITDEMDKQKREHEKHTRFKWKVCPTCRQRVPSSLRHKMHKTYLEGVASLKTKFDPLHEEHQDYIKRKKVLFDKIKAIEHKRSDYQNSRINAEHQLESCYKLYKRHKEKTEKGSAIVVLLRSKLKKAKAVLRHTRQAIAEEYLDKEMLIFAMAAFSRDGIPLYLNSLACPLLNKMAEEYSKLFIDGEIQVVFRLNDGELEPVVVNAHGSKTISGQSAGEMAWAGFITALALRELAPRTNLLVLDEPGFGLDPESAKVFGRKLALLKDKFETILVVTHNEVIASLLHSDRTLTIEKEHKISRLVA